MTILFLNGRYHRWNLQKNPLDHILNFTLSNLLFNIYCVNDFPSFYLDFFGNWKRYFSTNPEIPLGILSQYLCYNKFIIVDNSYVDFTNFSSKNINFVSVLVNKNCNFKSWESLKNEYHLDNKLYYQWTQLIHAIPPIWKQKISDSEKNIETNYVACTRPSPNKKTLKRLYYTNSPQENYIQCCYYHQAITNFPKILWQSFSKWKIRLEKKIYMTKSNHYK